ncbi:hypothetical protein Lser_V15G37674 [Lactuca serriola]
MFFFFFNYNYKHLEAITSAAAFAVAQKVLMIYILAVGLLEVSGPSLSDTFFQHQQWIDMNHETDEPTDSYLKHKSFHYKNDVYTRSEVVVPIPYISSNFSKLLNLTENYVSETDRIHVIPSQVEHHIIVGLASVVGGLSAPYERVRHIHERPVVNWLLAAGCHPFGPFSNAQVFDSKAWTMDYTNPMLHVASSSIDAIGQTIDTVSKFIDLESLSGVTKEEWRQVRHTFKKKDNDLKG